LSGSPPRVGEKENKLGQAKFHYNAIANRWELLGKGGRLIRAFDDGNQGVPVKEMILVGSSIATSLGTLSTTVATIAIGANPLKRGDVVYGNPVAAFASNVGISGFVVPSNGLLTVLALNPTVTPGTLPASGWNIYAIRKTGTT
jgi:hypothetical protein